MIRLIGEIRDPLFDPTRIAPDDFLFDASERTLAVPRHSSQSDGWGLVRRPDRPGVSRRSYRKPRLVGETAPKNWSTAYSF